jgi:hypothetical protein
VLLCVLHHNKYYLLKGEKMRLSNLTEGTNLSKLKSQLLQPGIVDINDAGSSSNGVSLGDLQDIGAGRILRRHPSFKGDWFGFQYEKMIDGQPIQASIRVGDRTLKPGQRFMDEI